MAEKLAPLSLPDIHSLVNPKDLGAGELFTGAAKRSIGSLASGVTDVLPAMGGSALGFDEYAKEQMAEHKAKLAELEAEYPTAYRSYKDVQGISDGPGFLAEALGGQVPTMAAAATGAGAGALGAKLLGAAVGTGAKVGLGAASGAMNIPDTFDQIYQDTGSMRPGLSMAVGSVVSWLDTALPKQLVDQLGGNGLKVLATKWMDKSSVVPTTWKKEFTKEMVKDVGMEGLTEGAQQAIQNLGSSIADPKHEFFSQENIDRIIDSAIKGSVGGGAMGAPSSAIQALHTKAAVQKKVDEQNAPPVEKESAYQQYKAQPDMFGEELAAAKEEGVRPTAEEMDIGPPKGYAEPTGEQADLFEPRRLGAPPTYVGPNGEVFSSDVEARAYKSYMDRLQAARDEQAFRAQYAPQEITAPTPQPQGLLPAPATPVSPTGEVFTSNQQAEAYRQANEGLTQQQQENEWQQKYRQQQYLFPAESYIAKLQAEKGERPGTVEEALAGPPEAETELNPVIDAATLKSINLKPQAGAYTRLLNTNVATPKGLANLRSVIKDVQSNDKVADSTKAALRALYSRFATQQEMFGPKGGVRGESVGGRGRAVSGDTTGGAGVSATVPVQPTGQATAGGTEVSDQVRLGTSEPSTTQPSAGTETQPTSLNELREQAADHASNGNWDSYFKTLEQIKHEQAAQGKAPGIKEVDENAPQPTVRSESGPTEVSEIQNPEDYEKVTALLKSPNPRKLTPEAKAARAYFGKPHEGILAHLLNMAHDDVFNTPKFKQSEEGATEAAYYHGMNANQSRLAQQWVEDNLSPETTGMLGLLKKDRARLAKRMAEQDAFRRRVDDVKTYGKNAEEDQAADYAKAFKEETSNADKVILSKKNKEAISRNRQERIQKDQAERETSKAKEQARKAKGQAYVDLFASLLAEEQNKGSRNIEAEALTELSHPLHPGIVHMLRSGNLQGALRSLAGHGDRFVSRIASKFSQLSPTTKVVISDSLRDEQGRSVPGYFDPKTNTIHLDSKDGLSTHVLLHEVGHSLLSAEIDKPGSILARQLQQLFDKIKDSFPHAYGATDVHEFASEGWSNREFVGVLQSINPDGSPHSAWDRFARAVTNFFRRILGLESKPLTSAYDVLDNILSDMIAPAPEFRDAGALYAPRNQASAMDAIDSTIRDYTPGLTNEQKAAVSNAIKRSTNVVKSAIFALLPMHALSEVADTVFPGLGTKINNLINERSGYENTLTQGIDTIVNMAKHAIKTEPRSQSKFDDIVHESTIDGVDPTKPRTAYDKDAEKQKIWDNLHSRYEETLPKVWRDLYVTMRDGYKGLYKELEKAIGSRLDDTNLDAKTKAKLKKDIFDKLTEKEPIDPYFALGREGDVWLAFNHDGERHVEAFKSEYERSLRMDEVRGLGATSVDPYASVAEINFRNAPPNSFVNGVLKLMEVNKVPEDAIQEMMRLFMSTLPETAMAKALQKRKRRLGYKSDSIGVFERKSRNMAHQISNMVYNPKLTNVVDQMEQHTIMVGHGIAAGQLDALGNEVTQDIPARDNKLEAEYLNEFKKHIAYVKSPTKHDLGSILTSTAFTYTLGFNLSSAMVNMANVPMIVAPYLKGKYGSASVSGALGDASRVFLGAPRTTKMPILGGDGKMHLMNVMPSIMNYAADSEVGSKYATLVKIAGERGQLNRSQLYELLNGDTRTGILAKVNAASGWAFHHGERMNREVTMMAAFDLEMQKLKEQGITGKEAEEHAANQAIYTAELTNGGIAAAAAPRVAQNALGKMLFMYKRYGVSMYYMLFKTFKEALQHADPEIRSAAWKQIGGIFGMSALMAGAQGIPMFGLASMVYSLFCDEDDDDLDTVTRKSLGEFAYKGPLEYMTGLSIAGRITLNDLVFRDVKGGGGSQTFTQQMLSGIGGPVFGVADKIQRGFSKIDEGHIERGIEDILPSALANPLKAYRYATQGANTLRGDPINNDISAWNVAAQAFGFAPAEYTRQLEKNADIKGKEQYALTTATKLRSKFALAKRMGDNEGANEYKKELLELGHKHPGLKINTHTINEALAKTLKGSKQASQESRHGVRYAKKMLGEVKQEEDEWENGYGD